MTLIQIKNGKGRPVNPINLITDIPVCFDPDQERIEMWKQQQKYDKFEQSVTEHEAPGFEEGEAEGELIAFFWDGKGWIECNREIPFSYYDGNTTKQIWIVPAPEKVEVKEVAVGNLLHEAASKHASKHASNSGRDFNSIEYNIIFHAFIAGANWQQQKQAETISRLRGDMEWIAKFCNDPACKRLAKEAIKEKES